MQKFVEIYEKEGITSIAFPKLGCGNGGLDWAEVKPVMEKYLRGLLIDIYIYVDNYSNSNVAPDAVLNMTMQGIQELIKNRIVPLSFSFSDKNYTVAWDEHIEISDKDSAEVINIAEEAFYDTWSYIKKMGVFEQSEAKETAIIEGLLYSLGYLSKVKIHKGNNVVLSGYQVNEGANRRFIVA